MTRESFSFSAAHIPEKVPSSFTTSGFETEVSITALDASTGLRGNNEFSAEEGIKHAVTCCSECLLFQESRLVGNGVFALCYGFDKQKKELVNQGEQYGAKTTMHITDTDLRPDRDTKPLPNSFTQTPCGIDENGFIDLNMLAR
jgi:hypothetical protein